MTETKPTYGPPQPVTAAELDEWQALCDRATPGPWTADGNYLRARGVAGLPEMIARFVDSRSNVIADTSLAAEAVNVLPRLIAEVRRLSLENAEMGLKLAVRQFLASQSEALLAEVRRLQGENERLRAQAREPGPEVW